MLARRREYLYLGGLLSSGLSILLWLHFASSIFGGSMALFKFEVLNCVVYLELDTEVHACDPLCLNSLHAPFCVAVVFWTVGVCGVHCG